MWRAEGRADSSWACGRSSEGTTCFQQAEELSTAWFGMAYSCSGAMFAATVRNLTLIRILTCSVLLAERCCAVADDEAHALQAKVRDCLQQELKVELR